MTSARIWSIALICVFVAACGPPTTDAITIDVEQLPNGEIVRRTTNLQENWTWAQVARIRKTGEGLYEGEYSSARGDIEWETLRQVCATDDLCVRISPGARIEESRDAGDSWFVAWDLENRSPWVNASGSDVARVIETFDIEKLTDGRIMVAMGELDVVVRDLGGGWTPSVADLRTLPKQEMAPLLMAVLITLAATLVWSAGRAPGGAPKRAGFAAALGGVATVPFLIDLISPRGLFMPVLLIAGGLALVTAVISLATLLGSSDQHLLDRIAMPFLVVAAALSVALALAYVLWSQDVIPWRAAVIASIASTVAAFAFGWFQVAPHRAAQTASTGMRPYRNR